MRTGKANQEDEEYEEEALGPKKEGTSTPNSTTNAQNNDKARAIRSKHSVTEQRRRSKINERFQILRNLIPHSDQKRDTASFLLEVIEYVQYLQEKEQKYEGSYQGWTTEPTKLVPWRNSHWRVPSFVVQPQTVKNDLGPALTFHEKLEDNTATIAPSINTNTQNAIDSGHIRDIACKPEERQPELANKGIPLTMPHQTNMAGMFIGDGVLDHSLQDPVCDAHSSASELLHQEELSIEGGTISISSAYSEGLLNNLTQALQSTGLDLTQASISVQINLGKRADKGLTSGSSLSKDNEPPSSNNQAMGHARNLGSGNDSDIPQKRLKT